MARNRLCDGDWDKDNNGIDLGTWMDLIEILLGYTGSILMWNARVRIPPGVGL